MKRVLVSVQEASADRLAAELVEGLRGHVAVEVEGLVGPALRAAGVRPLDAPPMDPVMGLAEVLRHLGTIRRRRDAVRAALKTRPDLLLVVDSADFHLPIAREARRLGIPTVGYVGPQLWAWRPGRVRTVAAALDRLLCLWPFEPALYDGTGLDVRWVGHPAVDRVRPSTREPGVLAIFPGSRRSELRRHLPPFLEVARRSGAREVLLPLASTLSSADLGALSGVRICTSEEALGRAERALTKSGTSTLELTLAGIPTVVAHRVHPLTYVVGRALVRGVSHLALPNILLGRAAIPERVQHFTVDQLLSDLKGVAEPPTQELRRILGGGGASARAAEAVAELLVSGRRS